MPLSAAWYDIVSTRLPSWFIAMSWRTCCRYRVTLVASIALLRIWPFVSLPFFSCRLGYILSKLSGVDHPAVALILKLAPSYFRISLFCGQGSFGVAVEGGLVGLGLGELIIKSKNVGLSLPAWKLPEAAAPAKKSLIDWKYTTNVAVMLLSTSAGCTPWRSHENDLTPAPGMRPDFPPRILLISLGLMKFGMLISFSRTGMDGLSLSYSTRDSFKYGDKLAYTSGQRLSISSTSEVLPPCWILDIIVPGSEDPDVTLVMLWKLELGSFSWWTLDSKTHWKSIGSMFNSVSLARFLAAFSASVAIIHLLTDRR